MAIEQDTNQQLLKDLRNLIAKEGNGRICIAYQTVSVTNAAAVTLVVPALAMSAEITVEDAGSTNTSAAVRYTIDGVTTPATGGSSADGVPLGDFDTVEILNHTNLTNFKVIAVDAANTKYLKIHYFA